MTPAKQLNHHDPANGVYGDCYRTAIACLLDMAPSEVPHVFENGGGSMETQFKAMDAWLSARDLTEINIPLVGDCPLDRALEVMGHWSGGIHYMLTGRSGTGCNHVVICQGREIVWDPSQTCSGILGPADDGYWWFSVLARRT